MNMKSKKGMTLNEIMIAVVIMAVAFIPIVGVMSSSMSLTKKDEHIIKAINICQETLNTALQFPYDGINFGSHTSSIKSDNSNFTSTVRLGSIAVGNITYNATLDVVKLDSLDFHVPMCDFTKRADDPDSPNKWMKTKVCDVKDLVKRYTVTVTWNEVDGRSRFYRLSALKADIRK